MQVTLTSITCKMTAYKADSWSPALSITFRVFLSWSPRHDGADMQKVCACHEGVCGNGGIISGVFNVLTRWR
jgi:hypothetical protein